MLSWFFSVNLTFKVSLWEMDTGMCHKSFFGHLRAVQSVSICGQDCFVTGDFDGKVNIWVAN
jgi:WD40 repeat protein